jgi:hypothetical protein
MSKSMKEFTNETRPCSECAHFKRPAMGLPICKKKLMSVIPSMLVTYEVEEGTCFDPKDSDSTEQPKPYKGLKGSDRE